MGGAEIAATAGIALAFVVAFLLVGRWAHHAIDRIGPRLDREQLLLGSLAIALGGAALGEAAGLSEAVGALLAGILLSGSEVRNQIEQQLLGLRDFAAAIFFFAFGLEVDLGEAPDAAEWLLLAVPVAVAGKLVGGYLAGRSTGFTSRESVNVGTALVARGEFTIILAEPGRRGRRARRRLPRAGEPVRGPVRPGDRGRRGGIDERVAAHREARVPDPLAEPTVRR